MQEEFEFIFLKWWRNLKTKKYCKRQSNPGQTYDNSIVSQCLPATHKVNWAYWLYSQKGEGTKLSAVSSCLQQSWCSPFCKWRILFAPITSLHWTEVSHPWPGWKLQLVFCGLKSRASHLLRQCLLEWGSCSGCWHKGSPPALLAVLCSRHPEPWRSIYQLSIRKLSVLSSNISAHLKEKSMNFLEVFLKQRLISNSALTIFNSVLTMLQCPRERWVPAIVFSLLIQYTKKSYIKKNINSRKNKG
jgi:hypothetical protein